MLPMNFRNKYLLHTIRILFGFIMLASGIMGFAMGRSTEGVPPEMVPMTNALWDSGIFHMIKVTEIVAGLMLIASFLPALAAIFLAPVSVGVVVVSLMVSPATLVVGIVLCLLNAYLGYAYWDRYAALFRRK
jgi:uncharacterized membrane protein YphA (DoxX/SURF4 family)